MTLKPEFHFLEVAYPYIARRLLTDEDPALRGRLFQVGAQEPSSVVVCCCCVLLLLLLLCAEGQLLCCRQRKETTVEHLASQRNHINALHEKLINELWTPKKHQHKPAHNQRRLHKACIRVKGQSSR